jgi:predicted unusual protein kinase regulating ubiquinone biosynthesis (AarF/ABC1/UbiB family)
MENGVEGVYIPEVYDEYCTRRLLVTEWIDGCKLSDCPPEEIREYIAVGQECFLTQLLQVFTFSKVVSILLHSQKFSQQWFSAVNVRMH